jgi:MATE family multidrug resistance protein
MNQNKKPLWLEISVLATPLILSMTGFMLMQVIDALFLSWYSTDAIGAIVPSGMASALIISFFQGTAGYTSTFVAHYIGAKQGDRACSATWQGIYFALISGMVVFLIGFTADPLFRWVGHSDSVRLLENSFFSITCWGSFGIIIANALGGYFSGQGKTATLMVAHISGFIINAILDYVLIFGKFGLPSMGIAGAAIATVSAQVSVAIFLFIPFVNSRQFGIHPWKDRAFNPKLFRRLIRFGFPSGLRFGFEMLAWTMFIFIVGRNGLNELAASNIAFRINGFAFFPIIGLGQALAILIGQAQGRRDPDQAVRITYTGLLMAELWMILAALSFVLFPDKIYSLFAGEINSRQFEIITGIGINLLRFVAVYSLLDACNIVVASALQAAGDTKWTMIFALIANFSFLTLLVGVDYLHMGIWVEWTIATLFVMVTALAWVVRFRNGVWRSIKVIEHYSHQAVAV